MIWRNSAGLSGPARSSGRWGRGSVYIRKDYPEEQETYFFEYDEQGYRTRQVVVSAGGEAERSGPADWVFNPPEDLWDPELAECEIAREEFEGWWGKRGQWFDCFRKNFRI